MAYDDGEVRQQFSIAFRCRPLGGEAQTSNESKAVRWLSPEEVEAFRCTHPCGCASNTHQMRAARTHSSVEALAVAARAATSRR